MGVSSSSSTQPPVSVQPPRKEVIGDGVEDPEEFAKLLHKCLEHLGGRDKVAAQQVEGTGREFSNFLCRCGGGPEFADQEFIIKKIKVDGVEYDLAFARAGSNVPESFHGIFWMDMFGQSSISTDPKFGYDDRTWWLDLLSEATGPADGIPDLETLAAFGEKPIVWDAEAATLRHVGYYGEKGHWTFPDTDLGWLTLNSGLSSRLTTDLVFEDAAMTIAYINPTIRIPGTHIWVRAPRFIFEMYMVKTEWGWARKTTYLGTDGPTLSAEFLDDLRAVIPKPWMKKIEAAVANETEPLGSWYNYPMVQIVDGNGRRTRFYDEYLKFMQRWGSDHQLVGALK